MQKKNPSAFRLPAMYMHAYLESSAFTIHKVVNNQFYAILWVRVSLILVVLVPAIPAL